MRIPTITKKVQYYVAYSENDAFSSWDSIDDSISCVQRFRKEDREKFLTIIGIIEVSEDGKRLLQAAYRIPPSC